MKRTLLSLGLAVALVGLIQSRSDSETNLTDYKIDGVHSAVIFKVSHMGVSHTWGRFDAVEGTLKFRDSGEGAVIDITVQAGSINTGNAKRDGHLKSPDFFSVKEFPTISFKSKSWKKSGDGFAVTGDFTLHGVTKSVTIPVTKVGEGKGPGGKTYIIGFDGTLKIKRTDYGMKKYVGPAGDEVTLHISIEGMRDL